jgi:hypothetical protein
MYLYFYFGTWCLIWYIIGFSLPIDFCAKKEKERKRERERREKEGGKKKKTTHTK